MTPRLYPQGHAPRMGPRKRPLGVPGEVHRVNWPSHCGRQVMVFEVRWLKDGPHPSSRFGGSRHCELSYECWRCGTTGTREEIEDFADPDMDRMLAESREYHQEHWLLGPHRYRATSTD